MFFLSTENMIYFFKCINIGGIDSVDQLVGHLSFLTILSTHSKLQFKFELTVLLLYYTM